MYYGQKVCVLPNSYIEALNSSRMVFGDGAFGRYLGLDGVTRMEPLMKGLVPS